ncbi:MAG: DUF11 domain-containing protein, partial [Peptostreptococcaceae bacterium]
IGANQTVTVTFKVTIDTVPSPNPIPNLGNIGYNFIINETIPSSSSANFDTNIVNTKVNHATLDNIQKYVSSNFASCLDVITYTIVIPNTGNTTAKNVIIYDTVPNGTMFITDSIRINGLNVPGETPNTGINVGDITPDSITTITFDILILC